MKVRYTNSHHLDWSRGTPFFSGTLLLSLFIAILFHVAFILTFNIHDLLPLGDKVLPFTDVQAELPEKDIDGVTYEIPSRYTALLPRIKTRQPKPFIPEVQKPTFFLETKRLVSQDVIPGPLPLDEKPLGYVLSLTEKSKDLIHLKEDAAINTTSPKSIPVLVDTRLGTLIPLRSEDRALVAELQEQVQINKQPKLPLFKETIEVKNL